MLPVGQEKKKVLSGYRLYLPALTCSVVGPVPVSCPHDIHFFSCWLQVLKLHRLPYLLDLGK
jgi:hypothetical protein